MQIKSLLRLLACIFVLIYATGCVGMAIGAATDATIEIVKVPFKVGGAVIDVVNGDEEKEDKTEQD